MTSQVQLPGGTTITVEANTVDELLRRALDEFSGRTGTGVVPTSAKVVDAQTGYVLPGDGLAPASGRIVTTGAYGASIADVNLGQLALDLIVARKSEGYGERYLLALLTKDTSKLIPFRAYWWYMNGWWSATVTLTTYPLPVGLPYHDFVTILPDGLLPLCPVHDYAWHPHVGSRYGVCFGRSVLALPGNTIINLVEAVHTLLHCPKHDKQHLELCMSYAK